MFSDFFKGLKSLWNGHKTVMKQAFKKRVTLNYPEEKREVSDNFRGRIEVVKDEIILDKLIMSEDIKKRVREECNIQTQHFQVIMSNLRKHKVITNGKINPLFIPRIKEGDDTLQLLFLFDFSQDE